jgi:ferredoxin
VKIKVDFDLCESNALCESLAPDVFEIDDDDYLQLKTDETTAENEAAVRRAVAACPRSAISLAEDA